MAAFMSKLFLLGSMAYTGRHTRVDSQAPLQIEIGHSRGGAGRACFVNAKWKKCDKNIGKTIDKNIAKTIDGADVISQQTLETAQSKTTAGIHTKV